MKKLLLILGIVCSVLIGCDASKPAVANSGNDKPTFAANDTIRIANKESDFEIIIFDPQFNSWFNSYAQPRSFYTQNFLETRNRIWVTEWNNRATQPLRYGGIYDFPINYNNVTDYGFEVNYMLYHYLTFFQLNYKQKLGGFVPRI